MANEEGIAKGTAIAGTSHEVAVYDLVSESNRKLQRITIAHVDGTPMSGSSSGGNATSINVASTANGTVVLAANAARMGYLFFNNSSVNIWWGFSATSLTTSNGILLYPGASYQQMGIGVYKGVIHAIVATGTETDGLRVIEW